MKKSVLIVADLDSQVYGSLGVASAFRRRGWLVTYNLDAFDKLPDFLLGNLLAEFDVVEKPLRQLAADRFCRNFDAVCVYTTGSELRRFREAFLPSARERGGRRPVLVCGYNGLVLSRFEEGLSWRLGYDVIHLNGPRDLEMFRAATAHTPFAHQPVVLTGLRTQSGSTPLPAKARTREKFLVFAEQAAIPAKPDERMYLFERLAVIAAENPTWTIVIRPRVRPKEKTFHRTRLHVEDWLAGRRQRPPNLVVSYELLQDLLTTASLFGTVSSTALFDALAAGVPSFTVADFGVQNDLGTHVFLRSGLMTDLACLHTLEELQTLSPHPDWLSWVGFADMYSPATLVDLVESGGLDLSTPPPAFYQEGSSPLLADRLQSLGVKSSKRKSLASKLLGMGKRMTRNFSG